MKVLVVDDDKLARKGLISIMDWKKYGFEVVGDVQNGRKALEFLKDNEVDIVFTDIDMPEIDGIELMKMCKKEYPINEKSDIPFLYIRCGMTHTSVDKNIQVERTYYYSPLAEVGVFSTEINFQKNL